MTRRHLLAGMCLYPVAAQPPPAQPQQPQPQQPEAAPIRVAVNEVIVPITVTDEKGRFVSALEKSDFRIFDEGAEQRIAYFSSEHNLPVVVGFLIDISNASRVNWKFFQEAAINLVDTLLPGDKRYSGYLITYGNEAELAVNTHHDPEKMMEKLRKTKPGGGAALYDAIYMACTSRDLVKGEPIEPRRIIVIIGDGHDTASKKGLNEVLELAQRNQFTIYGVSTVAYGFNSDGEKNLTRLAEATGGRVEYPLNSLYKDVSGYLSTPSDEGNYAYKVGTGGYAAALSNGMFKAIAAVTGEITTQYVVRYVPDTSDVSRGYRSIRVEVKLPYVKIRHKDGYYPFAP